MLIICHTRLDSKGVDGIVGNMTPPGMLTGHRLLASTRKFSSQVRATMAAMSHDTITAALWALSSYDPALVHLAELREKFTRLSEENQIRITIDRLVAVYVEGQCTELLSATGITTHEADQLITDRLGDTSTIAYHVTACTSDPLAMEIFGYALYLGVLTAHGDAPWKRFAAVMAECHHYAHPAAASA